MSNEWDITGEIGDENVSDGPKPLRDAYKAQKEANQKLMERLEKLEAVNNRNAAADLIEAAGAKRTLAKHYTGDPDPDKISSWLNDFRDALGVAQSQPVDAAPSLTSETQAQYEKMNQQGTGSGTTGNLEAAAGDLSGANSTADLIAALAKLQS
jgi:hypothetical protein